MQFAILWNCISFISSIWWRCRICLQQCLSNVFFSTNLQWNSTFGQSMIFTNLTFGRQKTLFNISTFRLQNKSNKYFFQHFPLNQSRISIPHFMRKEVYWINVKRTRQTLQWSLYWRYLAFIINELCKRYRHVYFD